MPLSPRKNIEALAAGVHGGVNYAEFEKLGINPDTIIDFSVSTNPLGMPPGILAPVSEAEASRYPDSSSRELVRAIARKSGLDESNVLAGAGSTELIRLAVTAYLGENDRALVLGPTYGEYRTACEIAGAEVIQLNAAASADFRPDTGMVADIITQLQPKAVFICNPNNPTGSCLEQDEIQRILEAVPDTLVVLDEAYAAFSEGRCDITGLCEAGNLLVVRSMTKDYAIAGLRLGYAFGHTDMVEVLKRVAPPWNVNILAQKAGIAALAKDDYLEQSREAVREGRFYLIAEFEKLGFRCVPSVANFFLAEVGDAAELRKKLLGESLMVRDCASFGIPDYIRVAVRSMADNRKLITGLKAIRNSK